MNLAHKWEEGNVITLHPSTAKKKERQAMSDQLTKGFIMKSRLYHYEVEPFISDAAKNVYSAIMGFTNGFNKPSDHISHRQLQGGKLTGSNKLGSATVSSGLKELTWFGVISVVEKNNKLGNKYQIHEVSLKDVFEQFGASVMKALRISNESASLIEALQKLKRAASVDDAQGASVSDASIEFLFIDSFRNIKNITHALKKPLEHHFFLHEEIRQDLLANKQKLAVAEQERIKSELISNTNLVFEFWKTTFQKPRVVLSEVRKSRIQARLKQGYSVIDIQKAILNCSKSNFHITNNHIDLELICRNEQKLDYFIDLNPINQNQNQFKPAPQQMDSRNVNDAWANQQTHYDPEEPVELEDWML